MMAYSLPCTRPALLFCTWLFRVALALEVIAGHMPMSLSHFHCSFASKIKSNSATSYSHTTLIYSYTFKIFLFIINTIVTTRQKDLNLEYINTPKDTNYSWVTWLLIVTPYTLRSNIVWLKIHIYHPSKDWNIN